MTGAGPLSGCTVVELAGMGPGPLTGMLLADMGARVIRIDRPPRSSGDALDQRHRGVDATRSVVQRGRESIVVNMKSQAGVEVALSLIDRADALIEGYRPGVMERLGLGPEVCCARNPRLVYGRVTGWGQEGPLANRAGHDIDYIAVAGALSMFARFGEAPVPPRNYVGDMGGGGLVLAFGIVCALYESKQSGLGQVIDAAMVDGVAALGASSYMMLAQGRWSEPPGTNYSDTGSPFYNVYETSDGRYLAVGALETEFYQQFVAGLELTDLPDRSDPANWPALKERFGTVIRERTQAQWTAVFEGLDACAVPVMSLTEAAEHPHLKARGTIVERDGVLQPAPAPRLSRTPATLAARPPQLGESTRDLLAELGLTEAEIEGLFAAGDVR